MCLNYFARSQGIRFDKRQGGARTGAGEMDGTSLIVARPQTYMNRSGQAVDRLMGKFQVSPDNLLVIHDDLDLSLGKIRLRQGGGSGGHKGVDSVTSELGSRDFLRLRVGIGRPPADEGSTETDEADIIDYVLGDFTAGERQTVDEFLPQVSEAIVCLFSQGLTVAMNKYN